MVAPSPTAITPTAGPPHTTTLTTEDVTEVEELLARVADLEQQVVALREGLHTRQQIGFITGVLAERHDLQQDQAWDLLVSASQHLSIKIRRLTEVLQDAYNGALAPADAPLAVRITVVLSTLTPAPPSSR